MSPHFPDGCCGGSAKAPSSPSSSPPSPTWDEKPDDHQLSSASNSPINSNSDGNKPRSSSRPSSVASAYGTVAPDDDVEAHQPARQATHSSSTEDTTTNHVTKIPRSERRGLLSQLCLIREVDQPTLLPVWTKWWLTAIIGLAATAGPMGSSIILPALQPISHDFSSPPTITNLSTALYLLALGIFPLWWSTLSETFGRRSIYLISFTLFAVFAACAAISRNVATLVAMRTLSGGAAASVQAVGAGSIADLWEVRERGRAMGFFYLGPLLGPFLGPIIGGGLALGLGWRSVMWFLAIMGGVITLAILLFLPETLPRADQEEKKRRLNPTVTEKDENGLQKVLSRQSVKQATKRWTTALHYVLIDPLSILLLLRYPPILLTVWLASVTFGCLYFISVAIQTSFSSTPYNYDELTVGLLYIPSSIGYVTASILGGRWIDKIMHREAKKANRYDENGKLVFRPEDRMRENAWIAGVFLAGGLIWWGWSIGAGAFWVIPSVANIFFGLGSMLVFGMATTMLTEFLPRRASAGIALNNFVRNFFSCAGSLAAEPIIRHFTDGGALGHGNGWIFTVVGAFSLLSTWGVVFAILKFGEGWRRKMGEELH